MTFKAPVVHETFERAEDTAGASNRSFGMVFTVVFGAIGAYGLWRGAPAWPYWIGAAGVFAAVTLLAPAFLAPLNRLWMRLALALSKVTTPLVMAVLFYGTVLPTGLVMRLLNKDPLRLKWEPKASSYWIQRSPPGPPPDSLKNQF
jgi:hypothetical protein